MIKSIKPFLELIYRILATPFLLTELSILRTELNLKEIKLAAQQVQKKDLIETLLILKYIEKKGIKYSDDELRRYFYNRYNMSFGYIMKNRANIEEFIIEKALQRNQYEI